MAALRLGGLVGWLVATLILSVLLPFPSVKAQNSTAEEIIAMVNAVRAARGLAPYQIDADLMAYAQAHSQYQASIHYATHQHKDGATAFDQGIQENVATGNLGWITPYFAVYQIWSDDVHMNTMVGYSTGTVGAGVANDGEDEYYTLNVRPGGSAAPKKPGKGASNATATRPIPMQTLVTMTQRPNGCTIHVVGYGQTLWAIALAYGVKINDIRAMNNLSANSTDIYAGQKLVIRCVPVTPTPAASQTIQPENATFTPDIPSATMTPPRPQIRVMPPTFTATQVAEPEPASGPPAALVAGLLILTGGSLLVIVAFGLIRKG